jgi:hypothetical protein
MTPEERAKLLGEMLSFVANLSQPATFSAVLKHLMTTLKCREEDIGEEFYLAWFLLVRSGLAVTNTSGPDRISVQAGTTIAPSPQVLSFLLSDDAEAYI